MVTNYIRPEGACMNIQGPISDAQFLEICRNDAVVREMFLKLFAQLEAEESNLALSSSNSQR